MVKKARLAIDQTWNLKAASQCSTKLAFSHFLGEPKRLFTCLLWCLELHGHKHECVHVLVQVVVQGIPFAFASIKAWQDLKDLFKPVRGVKADIVMGQDGRSKGWGTVLFDSQEDAEKAIKVH